VADSKETVPKVFKREQDLCSFEGASGRHKNKTHTDYIISVGLVSNLNLNYEERIQGALTLNSS
jgi:hypothetical protein